MTTEKKTEKVEEKRTPAVAMPKTDDRAATTGTPDDAADMVKKYFAKHKDRFENLKAAQDYLIYVGFNRRAALERYEPAAPKKKPAKKTEKKAA